VQSVDWYVSLGRRRSGVRANMWQSTKVLQFFFQTGSSSSSSFSYIFFLIDFIEEAFIINIIKLCINYIIIICVNNNNNNNAVISNNLCATPRPYFALKNSPGHAKGFLRSLWTIWARASKIFASPVMRAKTLLLENCALLGYYAASGGNFFTRRFGTTYRSHFQGSRIQILSYNIHLFSILSDDRFQASPKTIPSHSAI